MTKYRLKEYLYFHWNESLLDFTKDIAHMEYHIQERKNIIFWKTINTFTNKTTAEQEFKKLTNKY